MHRIAPVQSVGAQRYTGKERMVFQHIERVPARMRKSSNPEFDGTMRSTSPAIHPRPGVTLYSRPRSAINCIPTQMPKKSLPIFSHALLKRVDHAGI